MGRFMDQTGSGSLHFSWNIGSNSSRRKESGVVVYPGAQMKRRMDSKDSQQSLVVIVHNIIHTKKHTLIKAAYSILKQWSSVNRQVFQHFSGLLSVPSFLTSP